MLDNYRRKFRSQTSDNMDRWKAEMGKVREKRRVEERRVEERRSEKRKSQKKEDAGARKGRKVTKHCVFPKICGSGGSKSRLAKAAGAEPSGQMRDEQLHAVVARSTFPSQKVQNTTCSDHFWTLRCRKSARRCGAKHISKSKCTKHTRSGIRISKTIIRIKNILLGSKNKYYRDQKKLFWEREGRKEAESGISGKWTLVESGSPTISTWFNSHSLATGMLCIIYIYVFIIYIYIFIIYIYVYISYNL